MDDILPGSMGPLTKGGPENPVFLVGLMFECYPIPHRIGGLGNIPGGLSTRWATTRYK